MEKTFVKITATPEIMKELIFKSGKEIFEANSGHYMQAAIYNGYLKTIQTGGLFINSIGIVCFDNLPKSGYSISTIDNDEINNTCIIFKKVPFKYEDVVFYRGKTYMFNLKTGNIQECCIQSWEHCEYYSVFEVKFLNNTTKLIRASNYGEEYVFLKP